MEHGLLITGMPVDTIKTDCCVMASIQSPAIDGQYAWPHEKAVSLKPPGVLILR